MNTSSEGPASTSTAGCSSAMADLVQSEGIKGKKRSSDNDFEKITKQLCMEKTGQVN